MSVTDIKAAKKWRELPKEIQKKLLNNVFCGKCFTTTIVDYTLHMEDHGVLLKGKCKRCEKDVARLIENDWWKD